MKFTIIPVDKTAVSDGVGYLDLDLSSAGIPANVHALQWQDTAGIVEYMDLTQETITVLPDWAARVLAIWQAADDAANAPPPDPTPEALAAKVREQRNAILAASDWMALSDVTMSPEWAAYRQALRDVPDQVGFPENVTWPVKPE